MNPIAADYIRTHTKKPPPIASGLDAHLYGLMGRYRKRASRTHELLAAAERISTDCTGRQECSSRRLKAELADMKIRFRRQAAKGPQALTSGLALVGEAAFRALGLRPYTVQFAGAVALYRGHITEMATGEGKTLTAALAAILHAWSGAPFHCVTANDYLAARDAQWLSPLYRYCGLSAGYVTGGMEPADRRRGYQCDITYTTSKEIVADFLRDRICLGDLTDVERRRIHSLFGTDQSIEQGLVMRGIHAAIVDEADSLLIDEAVTPLIISRPQPNTPFIAACRAAHSIASSLRPDRDYRVDHQHKEIELFPGCEERAMSGTETIPPMFRGPERRRELVKQALAAREFFHRNHQYVINGDKVVIVDEFTGRLMPQRTWSAGLHQLVEAKEGVAISPPSETLASLSFQRFFRMFHHLAGMTGTAAEASDELWHIYGLPFVAIPRNRPCRRQQYPRRIFAEQETKWEAIVDEIAAMHKQGRPVLIGTRSIKASEHLAARLDSCGLTCTVLNAVSHAEESEIVAKAGERNAVTVATNMAGRGTDIKLGRGVSALGGLHVIATECHESGRIDRQLFGRCARQGDPGSAGSFVSMEDELVVRFVPSHVRAALTGILKGRFSLAHAIAERAVGRAQRSAQKLAAKRRHAVIRMDTWLDDSLSFSRGHAL
ncbi:MAG: hypothetical protein GF344_08415 [Chitinivibrionales bacterium]|nr:hypothetical protein [Chitinivibrionales bacterium]MBD3356900.1 hypothetical protein [Chitinivibrionales bacterium]